MKILITGASGFIGSYLVEEALNAGMEVWAAVRQSSSRQYLQDSRIRFFHLHVEFQSDFFQYTRFTIISALCTAYPHSYFR